MYTVINLLTFIISMAAKLIVSRTYPLLDPLNIQNVILP